MINGPGNVPPASTAARLKPSGAISLLTMGRSATGPIESGSVVNAYVPKDKDNATRDRAGTILWV